MWKLSVTKERGKTCWVSVIGLRGDAFTWGASVTPDQSRRDMIFHLKVNPKGWWPQQAVCTIGTWVPPVGIGKHRSVSGSGISRVCAFFLEGSRATVFLKRVKSASLEACLCTCELWNGTSPWNPGKRFLNSWIYACSRQTRRITLPLRPAWEVYLICVIFPVLLGKEFSVYLNIFRRQTIIHEAILQRKHLIFFT